MAANNKHKLKLLYLIRVLENETDAQQGLSMPQLIERLAEQGISAERKSLYRDLAALKDVGFDIRTLSKRPVEYALVRSDLDFNDVMMLIDITQSSRFITERKSNQLVKNLKSLLSERERKQISQRVHVQGRIKNQSESVFRNVDAIHEAMGSKRKVRFLYFSYGTDLKRTARRKGKRYELTPVKIVFAQGNYYLAAFEDDSGTIKTYRIDRMELLEVSNAPAAQNEVIASYRCEDFAYQSFGMFDGKSVCVTLGVDAALMNIIVDQFGHDVEVARSDEDSADIRVKVRVSPQFFGWIAGLDGGVEIKSPKSTHDEYIAWLASLIQRA